MKIAILLQHYFPYGGLQRDAIRLAEECLAAGHEAHVIVSTWNGPEIPNLQVIKLASGGSTNHAKTKKFAAAAIQHIQKNEYARSIGFSRVPGADFYFAGDPCFKERFQQTKPSFAKLLPRYRTILSQESELFCKQSATHIFFLAEQEIPPFIDHYSLSKERYTLLPPWLRKPKTFDQDKPSLRKRLLQKQNIPEQSKLLLFVGSDFQRKGLDRAINVLPKIDKQTHLIICGDDNENAMRKLTIQLSCSSRVHFIGPSDEVPEWMSICDLLIHPARQETAGMVLLESLTYGLPVLCTKDCGYAVHIEASGAGVSYSQQESENELSKLIQKSLEPSTLNKLKKKALKYSDTPSRYETANIMLNLLLKN